MNVFIRSLAIVAALSEVGMAHRAGARPAELSGGEKQRVAIARALAKEPQLLFADEPTSALDADNGQRVIDILHQIARSHGTTVLCVSHDPRLVRHADRVLNMEDGRICNDWRPSEGAHPTPTPRRPGDIPRQTLRPACGRARRRRTTRCPRRPRASRR